MSQPFLVYYNPKEQLMFMFCRHSLLKKKHNQRSLKIPICFNKKVFMNKYITIFALIFFSTFVYSQISFSVSYETINTPKINYNGFNFPESQKAEIERQIFQNAKKPKKHVLYYDDGNSFFQRDPNVKSSSREQKTEFFRLKDKKGLYELSDYIVEEFYGYYPMDNVSVEFTNETQTIENYTCKLALYKIGDAESKVWYTEDIPISAGPYNYYKVPGLILKVESPDMLCYAVNISKNIDSENIKKMDLTLKIYEGVELKLKKDEGREKLIENSRQKADELIKNIQKK